MDRSHSHSRVARPFRPPQIEAPHTGGLLRRPGQHSRRPTTSRSVGKTHHPSAGSRMAYDDYRARRGPFSAHDAPPLHRLTIRRTRVESLPIVTCQDALQHLRQYCLTVQKARRPVGRTRRRRSRRRGHVRSHRRVGAHPVHRRRFALLSANGGRRQWVLSRHA